MSDSYVGRNPESAAKREYGDINANRHKIQ